MKPFAFLLVVVALFLCTARPTSAGSDCLEPEDYAHRIGNTDGNPIFEDLAIANEAALGVTENGQLVGIPFDGPNQTGYFETEVIDLSGFEPTVVGAIPKELSGSVSAFTVADGPAVRILSENSGFWNEGSLSALYPHDVLGSILTSVQPIIWHTITDEPAYHSTETDKILLAAQPRVHAAVGALAYVLLESDELVIVDASDPQSPVLLSTLPIPADRRHLAVLDEHVYLSKNFAMGIDVVDATDPSSPVIVGSLALRGPALSDGTHLYVRGDIYDATLPLDPVLTGSLQQTGADCCPDAVGDGFYISSSGPFDDAAILSSVGTGNSPMGLSGTSVPVGTVKGDGPRLAIDRVDAVQLYDLADPDSPTPAGEIPFAGSFTLSGATGYLSGPSDFSVWDIDDVDGPFQVGSTPSGSGGVPKYANQRVLVRSASEIVVIDVSNPATPEKIFALPSVGVTAVDFDGDLVFVATATEVEVYEITTNPPFGVAPLHGIVPSGNNPLGTVPIPGTPSQLPVDISVAEDLLLVYTRREEIDRVFESTQVFDVLDPTTPTWIYEREPIAYGFYQAQPPFYFSASGTYERTSAQTFERVGDYGTRTVDLQSTWIGAERVYRMMEAPGDSSSFEVWPKYCAPVSSVPSATATLRPLIVTPNPIHGAGIVSFTHSSEVPNQVSVWDAHGRRVRELPLSAREWDLRDDENQRVAAGVYFLRSKDLFGREAQGRVVVTR